MSDEDTQDDVPSDEPAKPSENVEDNASQKNELDPKTLLAQKKHWQEKAKKLQAELDAKGTTDEPKEEPKDEPAPVQQDDIKEWVKASQQGYSDEEIELAKKLKPGKLSDALADETVKAAISGIRSTLKSKTAIPEPSSKVATVGDKSFHELPKEERKRHYASVVQKALEKGKNVQRNLT